MMIKKIYFFALLIFTVYGCTNEGRFNKKRDTEAITALLLQERKAHFDRNA